MKNATRRVPAQRLSAAAAVVARSAIPTSQRHSHPGAAASHPSPAAVATSEADAADRATPSAPVLSTAAEANTLYHLHHKALHRYRELGWAVKWDFHDGSPFAAPRARSDTTAGGSQPTTTPRPSTVSRLSPTRSLTASAPCPFCAEEAVVRQWAAEGGRRPLAHPRAGAAGAARPTLVSTQPLPDRVASLRQWVDTYAHSRDRPALRACLPHLSAEAIEYLARIGLRTGWIAMKLQVELPPPADATALESTTAIAFHQVPSLFDLQEVGSSEAAALLRLPRFNPGLSSWAGATSGAALTPETARLFSWQRRVEVARPCVEAASGSVRPLGDHCACDVYLVLAPGASREKNELTVWGRSHRRGQHPSSGQPSNNVSVTSAGSNGDAEGSDDSSAEAELFFIARSLEDYWRLGAAFGWVYGWQLAYSTGGPPQSSLIWLRFFNPSALKAALALHR